MNADELWWLIIIVTVILAITAVKVARIISGNDD